MLIATPNIGFGESLRINLEKSDGYTAWIANNTQTFYDRISSIDFDAILVDTDLLEKLVSAWQQQFLTQKTNQKLFIIESEDSEKLNPLLKNLNPDGFLKQPIYFPDLKALLERGPTRLKENSPQSPVQSKTPQTSSLKWLQDKNYAAQFLQHQMVSFEACACAAFEGNQVLALTGEIIEEAAQQIGEIIDQYREKDNNSGLIRFVTLESSQVDYLLYASSLNEKITLAVLYDPSFPLNKVRTQSEQFLQTLKTSVYEEEIHLTETPHPEEIIESSLTDEKDDFSEDEEFLDIDISELLANMPSPDPEVEKSSIADDWVIENPEISPENIALLEQLAMASNPPESSAQEISQSEQISSETSMDDIKNEEQEVQPLHSSEEPFEEDLTEVFMGNEEPQQSEDTLTESLIVDDKSENEAGDQKDILPEEIPAEDISPEIELNVFEEELVEEIEDENIFPVSESESTDIFFPDQLEELNTQPSEQAFEPENEFEEFSPEEDLILPWETEKRFPTELEREARSLETEERTSSVAELSTTEELNQNPEKEIGGIPLPEDESGWLAPSLKKELHEADSKHENILKLLGFEQEDFPLDEFLPVSEAEFISNAAVPDLGADLDHNSCNNQTENTISGETHEDSVLDETLLETNKPAEGPKEISGKETEFPAWIYENPEIIKKSTEGAPSKAIGAEKASPTPLSDTAPIHTITPSEESATADNPVYTSVLVPNLPENILVGNLAKYLGRWVSQLCQNFGWQLTRITIRPDYLMWTIEIPESISTATMIHNIRTLTSMRIYDQFPELKRRSPEDFWAPGQLVKKDEKPLSSTELQEFIAGIRQLPNIIDL